MTPDAAQDAVDLMKGYFPTLTVQQGALLLREFEHYPESAVMSCVDAHAKFNEVPIIPMLLSAVRTAAEKLDDQAARKRAMQRGLEQLQAQYWERLDVQFQAFCSDLSQEAIARLKADAIATEPNEEIRARLARLDPQRSRTLKRLMLELIQTHAA